MFIKELSIIGDGGIIRHIKFHNGMNLIVDETVSLEDTKEKSIKSGNSVGKTTVLKLIHFCLGGERRDAYTDPENNKNIDHIVENFVVKHRVKIKLILKKDLMRNDSEEIIIERNFLLRNEKISTINDINYKSDKEFSNELRKILYPDLKDDSPSLLHLIANNIRYKDIRINNIINNIDPNTKVFDYETLYLYMLGCPYNVSKSKRELQDKIKQEKAFRKKLELKQSLNGYEYALNAVENEIRKVKLQKDNLNINENYTEDLDMLDIIKRNIGFISSEITNLKLKQELINKGLNLIEKDKINIDLDELRYLYNDVKSNMDKMHHTFEHLVKYHETMLQERKQLLVEEKEIIDLRIKNSQIELDTLLVKEKEYVKKIKKCDTLNDLEKINNHLNDLHTQMGEYQNAIKQIVESEKNMITLQKEVTNIERRLYSEEFTEKVKNCVLKFDEYFAKFSQILYGNQFHLKHEVKTTREGQKYYQFEAFNMSISSGRKQGEALAFDLAYIEYAQNQNIYHLDFLLNDKKELMDVNHIITISNLLEKMNIQLVFSILQDKIPHSMNNDKYVVLRLSQDDKLFKIEEIDK